MATRILASLHETREVVSIGGAKAPDEIVRILEKGPKYASEAILKTWELLTLVRDVEDQANRNRCIFDGVDTLLRQRSVSSGGPITWKRLSFCLNEHLKLSLADKEGGFAFVAE